MSVDPSSVRNLSKRAPGFRRLVIQAILLLLAGILAGMAAIAVVYAWSNDHLSVTTGIAVGYLALMVLVSLRMVYAAVRPHPVPPSPLLPLPATGELRTLSGVIDAAGAGALSVEITLTYGSLSLTGGAEQALLAHFLYDEAHWQPPFVRYVINREGLGRVLVSQRTSPRPGPDLGPNDWMIQLNDELPLDLAVRIGDGDGVLQLGGLPLTELDVWPGTGELTLDLGGDWKQSLAARVHSGHGRVTVCLPKQVGVRVVANGGPGALTSTDGLVPGENGGLVNAAYATSPVTLDLAIDPGLGSVLLQSVDPDE